MASENVNSLRNRKSSTRSESDASSTTRGASKGQKFKQRSQAIPLGNIFKSQRYWARFVIILAVVVIIYVSSNNSKERKFARQREVLPIRSQPLRCQSRDEPVQGCTPKTCGRYVSDNLITDGEVAQLLKFAQSGFNLFDGDTFDISSGTITNGKVQQVIERDSEGYKTAFSHEHLLAFKLAKSKAFKSLVERYDLNRAKVHLAAPLFFSKLTNVTQYLEYPSSRHQVNKDLYPAVFYTTVIYLRDFGKDFKGGRLIFVDDPATNKSITSVEPKTGRIMGFTAGAENTHYIEQVSYGEQYSLTIQFSCQESAAIPDPSFSL